MTITLMELLTLVGTLLNTGILTAIYYKMGQYDEKHTTIEKRLTLLEGRKCHDSKNHPPMRA